jgi:hypothetical protein
MAEETQKAKETPLAENDILIQTQEAYVKLKAENDRLEKLKRDLIEIEQRKILGGGSIAGSTNVSVPLTREEKWRQSAKARYAGTGLDPT